MLLNLTVSKPKTRMSLCFNNNIAQFVIPAKAGYVFSLGKQRFRAKISVFSNQNIPKSSSRTPRTAFFA
jgi:hypothetical protein